MPRGWNKIVNSAVLHALSIAATALTAAPVQGRCGVHLALVLRHVEEWKHLPVVELRRAA